MATKRMGLLGLMVVLAVTGWCIGSLGGSHAEAAALTMKFGHFTDEGHPGNLAAKQFATNVAQRTNGAIKIDVFANNALGSPPDVAEQVRVGTTDISAPTSGQLDKWIKAYGVVMLPFAYDDYDHAHRVVDGPSFDWFKQMAEKEGFILLANWEWGFDHITNSKRPINTPADMKGLKMRVPPEVQIQAAMEALGAITTVISFPEVYMALAQGVADGQENPIATIYYTKFYEVQKYLALTRHVYNNMILTVSAKSWAKLTPEQKTIFQEEGLKAGAYMRQLMISQEDDLIAKMEKAGVQVTRPDLAPFRALMGPAYKRVDDYAGAENVKKYQEFIEAARKK